MNILIQYLNRGPGIIPHLVKIRDMDIVPFEVTRASACFLFISPPFISSKYFQNEKSNKCTQLFEKCNGGPSSHPDVLGQKYFKLQKISDSRKVIYTWYVIVSVLIG